MTAKGGDDSCHRRTQQLSSRTQQLSSPDAAAVIPDSIRDPLMRHHWIAGAETPDLIDNTDDHEKNHVLLMTDSGEYELATGL